MARKKIVLATTIFLSSVGFITPVVAENKNEDTTNIGYVVEQSYDWTIPSLITFKANSNTDTQPFTVSVIKNIIGYNQSLHITLADDSTFKIADINSASNTRDYKVTSGNTTYAKGNDVLLVPSGTNTGEKELSFVLLSVNVQKAGTYKGTVSFVSSVK